MKFEISSSELGAVEVLEASAGAARRIEGLAALQLDSAFCAPAATCACAPRDNLALHRLLRSAAPGSVLVCAAGGRADGAYFGELMALDAQGRGLGGLVLDGAIRDRAAVARLGFPVFHSARALESCRKERALSVGEPVEIAGVEIHPGDQVVADADAVLVVPKEDWRAVESAALELRAREEGIRQRLRAGERLGELLGLPE